MQEKTKKQIFIEKILKCPMYKNLNDSQKEALEDFEWNELFNLYNTYLKTLDITPKQKERFGELLEKNNVKNYYQAKVVIDKFVKGSSDRVNALKKSINIK